MSRPRMFAMPNTHDLTPGRGVTLRNLQYLTDLAHGAYKTQTAYLKPHPLPLGMRILLQRQLCRVAKGSRLNLPENVESLFLSHGVRRSAHR